MGMLLMEAFRQPSFYRISAPDWVNEMMVEPIVDKTGLTGVYQFTVQLPRDEVLERLLRAVAVRVGSPTLAGTEPRSISIFKSLESLGLRLERRTVPVEMIVVDKISRTPTEN